MTHSPKQPPLVTRGVAALRYNTINERYTVHYIEGASAKIMHFRNGDEAVAFLFTLCTLAGAILSPTSDAFHELNKLIRETEHKIITGA